MKPVKIGTVAAGFTLTKYAAMAERVKRMAQANIRLGQIEAKQEKQKAAAKAREADAVVGLGRCEYLSLRHAQWKEKLYERARRREEWDAFQMRKLHLRYVEREQKKAEWLEFDPESVVTSFENLPDF